MAVLAAATPGLHRFLAVVREVAWIARTRKASGASFLGMFVHLVIPPAVQARETASRTQG
jgi:hypothetical protein